MKSTNSAYKNHPGKIENFTPGHSSATDKERREVGSSYEYGHFNSLETLQLPPHFDAAKSPVLLTLSEFIVPNITKHGIIIGVNDLCTGIVIKIQQHYLFQSRLN